MRSVLAALVAACIAVTFPVTARAAGTALVEQPDGTIKVYKDVHIAIRDEEMVLTTSDGIGTLVIGKAACTKVGPLIDCIPYDATLYQNGWKDRVMLRSGTVWLNPTADPQPLSHSSAKIAAHGVLLSVTSKHGTYVSLTGTIDEVNR
ncbi:MAG: hypothetical protein JO160_05345 [Candidatus Eremiobacteraeota bacterium]|nr:hypothetical protein [Candidatus Eremiobacteraeota bacterium]